MSDLVGIREAQFCHIVAPMDSVKKLVYTTIITVIFAIYLLIHVPGPEVIKLFSCSAQLRLKFILLINVKMPTILTFISRINYRLCRS